jgi:hypothetical protein
MLLKVTSDTITRFRGDTFADLFLVTENAVAVDLTGFSAKLSISTLKNPSPTDVPVYTLSGVIPNPIDGKIYFSPSTLQAKQEPGTYYYDVQLTTNTGDIVTIAKGTYKFLFDITP